VRTVTLIPAVYRKKKVGHLGGQSSTRRFNTFLKTFSFAPVKFI